MANSREQRQARFHEKRTARRYAAELPAEVRLANGTVLQVEVSDISTTGALIIGEGIGQADDTIELELPEFGALEARIAHCGTDFVGVEFLHPAQIRDRLTLWLAEEIHAED